MYLWWIFLYGNWGQVDLEPAQIGGQEPNRRGLWMVESKEKQKAIDAQAFPHHVRKMRISKGFCNTATHALF